MLLVGALFIVAVAVGVVTCRHRSVSSVVAADPLSQHGTPTKPAATTPSDQNCTQRLLASLDNEGLAGQLLVVGFEPDAPATEVLQTLKSLRPGGAFLAGRSRDGIDAVAKRTTRLRRAVTDPRIGLLIAADQEGGQVQALSGPGFSTIPAAEVQTDWLVAKERESAKKWGQELRDAGVNVDLAPVGDVVDPALGKRNLAVGVNQRSYGTAAAAVTPNVLAFIEGLRLGGVAASVKHFPGLGRVAPNTDFSANVRDTTTGLTSPWLEPFAEAVRQGVPIVMTSSAIYTRIDETTPAAFSSVVIEQSLRKQLGFRGVIISDDLGNAAAVADVPQQSRAVRFISAGGDLALTVAANSARPMRDGLLRRMLEDSAFADRVRASAARVMTLKESLGVLSCK